MSNTENAELTTGALSHLSVELVTWQKIATAPKDGTTFLARYGQDGVSIARFTDNKPDYRTTVYWNPHLVTDPSGETKFNYFNTDQSGNYRVVIEGIDAEGNLARKVFTYLVN